MIFDYRLWCPQPEVMRFTSRQIVFQEVPDETSLSYLISGCTLRCPGCHSADSWDASAGQDLTNDVFEADLTRFDGWITAVLFLGGEWECERLSALLRRARARGLKTCLYTGLGAPPAELIPHLDYVKTGPYIARLGGLASPNTNQRFFRIHNGRLECRTERFQHTFHSPNST